MNYPGIVSGILGFSIVFGVIMGMKGDKVRAMTDLFTALNDIIMALVNVIMWSVLKS